MQGLARPHRPQARSCDVLASAPSWRAAALRRSVCGAAQRRARAVRCLATIPVPDSGPVVSDLGWNTDFAQHYVKGKLIGQGSFGSVHLGIDLHSGKEVAIKVMPKQRGKLTRERTLQKLAKEVGILQRMQACRNTVRLLGCYEGPEEVMVVTGLCSGGDLQKLSDDHGALPERAVALIAYEVLQVVEKCHELGILHGDVKPANFVLADRTRNPLFSKDINLLFGAPWLLAIDFGCSQYLGHTRFSKRTGTPVYMSPEIFDRDYHWEADMWSLGIMLYQLYARRFPYWRTYEECRHAKLDEVAALVAEAPLPLDYGPWRSMSPEGVDFMRCCLERDYSRRMTVPQALAHPWLSQWLPEDDVGALGLSLESVGTSSDDEELAAAAAAAAARQQQQQQLHLQQQLQQALPGLQAPAAGQWHDGSQLQQPQPWPEHPGVQQPPQQPPPPLLQQQQWQQQQQQEQLSPPPLPPPTTPPLQQQPQQHVVVPAAQAPGQAGAAALGVYSSPSSTGSSGVAGDGDGGAHQPQPQQQQQQQQQLQQPQQSLGNIVPGNPPQAEQAGAAAAVGSGAVDGRRPKA